MSKKVKRVRTDSTKDLGTRFFEAHSGQVSDEDLMQVSDEDLIRAANNVLEKQHEQVAVEFKDPVYISQSGVGLAKLASKLSKRWPENMEFVLSFAAGIESIIAVPKFQPFSVNKANQKAATDAASCAHKMWPSRAEVRAFCDGWMADGSQRRIEDLERENKRLEERIESVMNIGMFRPFGTRY